MKGAATTTRRQDTQIRAPQLRVIDADGNNLGVLTRDDALDRARADGLHLLEVAPNATPPVARICDPGKLAYQEAVAARRRRKDGHSTREARTHEVKLRPQTAEGDLRTKLTKVRQFCANGDTVKVAVMLRGRQIHRDGDADAVVDRITAELDEVAEITGPHRSGRDIRLTLTPKRHR